MNYFNTIPKRKSTRRYSEKQISEEMINKIIAEQENFLKLIPLKNVNIIPAKGANIQGEFKKVFGDYGKLLNAPVYFILTTERQYKEKSVNTGFIGEQLVIYLTSLGLSSSWLASFNEKAFKGVVDMESGHNVQAIISAGYASNGFQDKIINKMMGKTSAKRKKLKKIVFKDFAKAPASKSYLNELGLLEIFEMARLAPSWHNTQPWNFIIKNNEIYLIMDFDESRYKLKSIQEKTFYYSLSMGAIMAHISLCMNQAGKKGEWIMIPKQRENQMSKKLGIDPSQGTPFARFEME